MALSPIKSRIAMRRSARSCREQTTGHENIKEGYPSIVLSWNETAVPMIVTVGLHDKSVARSHEGKDSYIVSCRIAQFISGSRWTTNRKVRNERRVSVVRHVNRIPRENRNLWDRGETMPSYTLLYPILSLRHTFTSGRFTDVISLPVTGSSERAWRPRPRKKAQSHRDGWTFIFQRSL